MAKRRLCQAMAYATLLFHLLSLLLPAFAEIHPLGGITDKNNGGIQDVDITISLDWDPDTVTGNEADPRGMTKEEFQTVINSFAKSLFAITNGLHRLRNVYVFKKKAFWDMADIRYISTKAGRSSAHVSYWKKKGGQITMYVYESLDKGVYTKDDYPGPVLAHECGHYIYGVYDEYKETGASAKTREVLLKENNPGWPASDDDGSQASIMNDHTTYSNWFSLEGGYGTDTKKNSAQYRMFGKSIWSTIVSDPATDHANARDDQRTWFDAFKGKSVLKAADLLAHQTNALTGWDSMLNIVWMTTACHTVMVLDTSMPIANWDTALKGCAAGIRQIKVDNWMTVMKGGSKMVDRTKITAANKPTLIAQVSALEQGKSVPVETSLRAALAEIVRQRTDTGTDMTSNIYLMTSGNPIVSFSLVKAFADAKAMLTVASYSQTSAETPATGFITVNDLSGTSGGKSNIASRSQVMKSHVARDVNALEDDLITDIAASLHPGPLAGGESHTMYFTAGPNDKVLEIALFTEEDEWGKIQPTLTDPAGHIRTTASVATGFSMEMDSITGMWIFSIDTSEYEGATGQWTAAMIASAPVYEPLFMVASSISELTMEVSVRESPLYGYVAQAFVKGDRPILGARVTAEVYDNSGTVQKTLALKDDGLNGDIKAEDGIYSTRIGTAYLADGEYSIIAYADDNNGQAVESDRGMYFGSSSSTTETSTGAFERIDESAFNIYLAGSSGSSSGGSCFIAEAAYGSWLDPHVVELRHFRDRWLLTCSPGRWLVRFYYGWSPEAAAFIRRHHSARLAAQMLLAPVVYSIRYPFLPFIVIVTAILLWNRRRWLPFVLPLIRGKK